MVRFEDLQDLWQKQQPPAGAPDTAPLMRALRHYSRRQNIITSIKLVVMLILLVSGCIQSRNSIVSLCGISVLTAGTAAFLAMDWRRQRAIVRLNFAEPSSSFLRSSLARLMEQQDPFRRYYWPFVLYLLVGINLLYLGLLRHSSTSHRLSLHLFGSVLPFAGFTFGRWVRARRFEAECRPLVNRLTEMLKALEERTQ